MKKIKVLIVDDSALVRKILRDGLSEDPAIEVVGAARDPYEARDLIVKKKPDVITLDVEMPRMDGLTFLKRYMPVYPTPTVMVSSLTERGKKIAVEALEAGAVDIVTKPKEGVADGLPRMLSEIRTKVKLAATVDVSRFARKQPEKLKPITTSYALDETTDKIIALGASTGGTEALARILPAFPATSPGIVIVQHIPAGFSTSFAERLNSLTRLKVKEAEDNDRIMPGTCLVAPGSVAHMEVVRAGGQYRVRLRSGDKVTGHRPSVDVLFHSVARYVGKNAVAALLTGMGRDGAEGLMAIKKAGGRTIAQSPETCVVYGMPKMAWEMGAAQEQLPLEKIPERLLQLISN